MKYLATIICLSFLLSACGGGGGGGSKGSSLSNANTAGFWEWKREVSGVDCSSSEKSVGDQQTFYTEMSKIVDSSIKFEVVSYAGKLDREVYDYLNGTDPEPRDDWMFSVNGNSITFTETHTDEEDDYSYTGTLTANYTANHTFEGEETWSYTGNDIACAHTYNLALSKQSKSGEQRFKELLRDSETLNEGNDLVHDLTEKGFKTFKVSIEDGAELTIDFQDLGAVKEGEALEASIMNANAEIVGATYVDEDENALHYKNDTGSNGDFLILIEEEDGDYLKGSTSITIDVSIDSPV